MRTVHDPASHRRRFRSARAWLHDVATAHDRVPSPPTLEAFMDGTNWAFACGRVADEVSEPPQGDLTGPS